MDSETSILLYESAKFERTMHRFLVSTLWLPNQEDREARAVVFTGSIPYTF
jgi:hypothetical protein